MDARKATAYNAHKCIIYLTNLVKHNHDDLTDKERVGVKQALDVTNKIYNKRKAVAE